MNRPHPRPLSRFPRLRCLFLTALAGLVIGGVTRTPPPRSSLLEPVASWPGHGRGPAIDVAIAGHHAYVAIDEGGLLVLDIADPTNPRRVGEYRAAGRTTQVQVVGTRAYLGTSIHRGGGCESEDCRGQLLVLDVADPTRPNLLGRFVVANGIRGMHVTEGLAFLAGVGNHQANFNIVDVSNPSLPVELGVDHTLAARSLWVTGSRAYAGPAWGPLRVLDIARPESPGELGPLDAETYGNITAIQSVDDLLYLVQRREDAEHPGRFLVCRTGADGALSLVATLPLDHEPLGIRIAGHHACLAMGAAGMLLVDVSDPSNPAVAGSLDTPGLALRIDVRETIAFVADYHGGLQAISLGDPTRPARVGSHDTGLTARQVCLSGHRAYLLSSDTHPEFATEVAARSRLEILDVVDVARPVLLGYHESPRLVRSMDVLDDLAYLVWRRREDSGLEIVDCRDPEHPTPLSDTPTPQDPSSGPWAARAVGIAGRHAYLTTDNRGLRILDVSDPTRPEELSRTNGLAASGVVRTKGHHAYVSSECQLLVADVAAPRTPGIVGWLDLARCGTDPGGVVVTEDTVCVLAGWGGFSIVDVRRPDQPVLAGAYDTRGQVHDLRIAGGYVYVAEGWEGLEVFAITPSGEPSPIARFATRGQARGLELSDRYVYLVEGGAGLSILGIAPEPVAILEDPASPTVALGDTATLTVRAHGRGPLSYQWYRGESGDVSHPVEGANGPSFTPPPSTEPAAYWVRVSQGAAVSDTRTARVGLIPPVSVELLARWPGFRRGPASEVHVTGTLALVTAGPGGLRIYDVADPTAPRFLSACDTLGNDATDVAVSGHFALVACGDLRIVDIADPTHPVGVGSFPHPARSVAVVGSFAYVLGADLRILDVRNPDRPSWVGTAPVWGVALEVSDGFAYVGSERYDQVAQKEWGVLTVVEVGDPANPKPVGRYETPGAVHGISALGSRVGLATNPTWDRGSNTRRPGGVEFLDVGDRTQPRLLGRIPCEGTPRDVVLAERYAYAAIDGFGVQTIDLGNPAAPRSVGVAQGSPTAFAATASAGRIYVAASDDGLQILDVSTPSSPKVLGAADTGGYAEDVAVSGDHAYLADGSAGLRILQVLDPARPVPVGRLTSRARRVAAEGSRVALAGDTGLVLDVTDPVHVRSVAAVPGSWSEVAVGRNKVYFAGTQFTTFEGHQPNPPEPDPSTPLSCLWSTEAIDLVGNQLCLAQCWDGLLIGDGSVPRRLRQIASYHAEADVIGVARRGDFACVLLGTDGTSSREPAALEVVDLRDVRRPTRIARIPLPLANEVAFLGSYALVTGDGLQILDLGDPYRPVRVGRHATGIPTHGLQVVGDLAYVAAGDYGLAVYRVTPQLRLNTPQRTGEAVEWSWLGAPGIRLQECTSLSDQDWRDVPGSDGASSLPCPTTNRTAFYRLIRP